ncbi:MAG: glycosyltransferase family 4 protein [Acidimicrobiia bacterium]
MALTLLTVSGTIPDDLETLIANDRRPRPDYRELASSFDGELIDHAEARRRSGRLGKIIERFAGPNAVLAYVCWRSRKRYDTIFTDGEQVGIPLAALLRFTPGERAKHLMIVHILSVPKKAKLVSLLRLAGKIDLYFVYASAQKEFIERELGVPSDRVILTPFAVDTAFFRPQPRAETDDVPVISAAGLEHRDYDTLIEAVRDLPVRLVIASGSPWSKRTDHARSNNLPSNVEVTRFDLHGLRDLYQQSRFVVVPLKDVEFQAGITTILEAMAMARAVVCTRTPGQTDTIVHDVNGLYVPPSDIVAMRSAITSLLDDPTNADTLGASGRAWAIEHAHTPTYAANLAASARGLSTRS